MKYDTEKFYDHTTKTTINISKKNYDKFNCLRVAKFLVKQKVLSDVTTSMSIVEDKKTKEYGIEYGCLINVHGIKPKYIKDLVWIPLKCHFMLDCSHIEIKTDYHGCINNLF